MSFYLRMKENWLTQKPRYAATAGVFILTFLVMSITYLNWSNAFGFSEIFKATRENVFESRQYYRLWTSLFVHGDGSHLFSNMVLFIPLLFLLSAYFGGVFWPIMAIFVGGLINAIVLHTLPPEVSLIGISGVDNWMGAAWLTLYYLIDQRDSRRRRFAVVLFTTFMLFVPDTYRPGVSYLSHFVGYVLGLLSGYFFYLFHQRQFQAAEVHETIFEEDLDAPVEA